MNRLIRSTLYCALALGSTSSLANLVTNGNFETGFSGPPDYRYLYNGDNTTLPGWIALDDGIREPSYIYDSTKPQYQPVAIEGRYAIVLQLGTGLQTIVNLSAGQSYALTFFAKTPPIFPSDPLQVSVDGNVFSVTPNGYETLLFTASSTQSNAVLEFRNPSPNDDNHRGYIFDDVCAFGNAAKPPSRGPRPRSG